MLALAGCAEVTARSTHPNTIRYSNKTDVQSLDPAIAYDTVSWPLVRLLYNGLVDFDENLKPKPWMAESWEVSPDARTYRFNLRPGIRFTNGREMVADDCKYTIERLLDPKTTSPGDPFFRNIVGAKEFQDGKTASVRGLRAPEKYRFVIELEKPDISFLAVMSLPFTYVVPKEEVVKHKDKKSGEDLGFYRNPVGTGPMKLVQWIRGTKVVMERNVDYWDREHYPRANRFELFIGGDDMIRLMMFERGELDLFDPIPTPDFARIIQNPKWQPNLAKLNQLAISYLSLNCELKPLNNKKVRQAMNYAIDRDAIIRIINGRGVPAQGVLPPGMPGYNPKLKGYTYDPQRAKRLLAEAGYPDGFPVTLWTRTERAEEAQIAEVLQSQYAAIGVKVELHDVAFSVWDEAVGRRKNVAFSYAGWFMDYPDPYDFLDVLLNGDKIVDLHCNNYAFYRNPRVDAILRAAAQETNAQKRLQLYSQADELVTDDAPWVFMYYPVAYFLHQPWIDGYKVHPIWPYRFERLAVKR